MDLEVFWAQLAEDKLFDIFTFYKQKASEKVATKIINEMNRFLLLLFLFLT